MHRLGVGTIMLLALVPALRANEPPRDPSKDKAREAAKPEKKPATPAEQYRALDEAFRKAQQDFFKAYQQAETQEEKNKLFQEKYPQPAKYADQMLALAAKYPKDAVAVDALVWVVTRARFGPQADKAWNLLLKDHIDSPKLGPVASTLVYTGSNPTEKQLRTILEKSPHKEVRALACFSLGQYLKNRAERPGTSRSEQAKLSKEAEAQFERVLKDFPGVEYFGTSLADQARGELFAMRHLGIGKKAPEIRGEDLEGKPFKLSDYQGKVVVLDFWGHW